MWEYTYTKYASAGKSGLFRTMHPNIAFLGECKKKAKCKHTQNTSRIWRLTLQTKPLIRWLFVCRYMHFVRYIHFVSDMSCGRDIHLW